MKSRVSILLLIIAVASIGLGDGSIALAEPSQIVAFAQSDFQMANVPDGTFSLFKSVTGELSGFVKKRLPPRRLIEGRDVFENPWINGRVIEGRKPIHHQSHTGGAISERHLLAERRKDRWCYIE